MIKTPIFQKLPKWLKVWKKNPKKTNRIKSYEFAIYCWQKSPNMMILRNTKNLLRVQVWILKCFQCFIYYFCKQRLSYNYKTFDWYWIYFHQNVISLKYNCGNVSFLNWKHENENVWIFSLFTFNIKNVSHLTVIKWICALSKVVYSYVTC